MSLKRFSPVGKNGNSRSRTRADAAQPTEEIVPANLRALETVYFAAMLEEVRLFDVVDRLAALFSQGSLPLSPGRAGATLYRYWKRHQTRLTTAQRQWVYARA